MLCKIAGLVFAAVITLSGIINYKPVEKCNGGLMDVALKGCDPSSLPECPVD